VGTYLDIQPVFEEDSKTRFQTVTHSGGRLTMRQTIERGEADDLDIFFSSEETSEVGVDLSIPSGCAGIWAGRFKFKRCYRHSSA